MQMHRLQNGTGRYLTCAAVLCGMALKLLSFHTLPCLFHPGHQSLGETCETARIIFHSNGVGGKGALTERENTP